MCIDKVVLVVNQHTLPKKVFPLIARFGVLEKDSARKIFVEHMLHVVGYSLELMPHSCVLSTAGSVLIGL